ncbi:MAG: hypothetical protein CMI96_00445 [Pelagibacteraceae bacterium]|nr:hypothetical protein [Pelagibacteraceae bacterium]|tara:strand:- start:9411 stop:10682 length:1272 start_codon:yes stop_codon:yes gene_type:complete
METGIKLRLIIFNILIKIYKNNLNFENLFINKYESNRLSRRDRAFIQTVCLTTMRYQFHTKKILNQFLKKKYKSNQYILLISAITQILFLEFKDYAVIHSSVELAKKLKIYPGLINAVLNKISNQKKLLIKTKVDYEDLPYWFKEKNYLLSSDQKKKFLNNFFQKPSIHIVFKDKKDLANNKDEIINTSEKSGFLVSNKKIEDVDGYILGKWWVQDFSTMLPIAALKNLKNKKVLDLCAAPGGKTFQLLSAKANVDINDINNKRLVKLNSNLKRLGYHKKVTNMNALNFPTQKKYDYVIIDSPCSGIGTIRRNPEIFFKQNPPNFKSLINLQKKLLIKGSELLNKNGILIYMVCSFFPEETINQMNFFIKKNKNFSILKFPLINKKINNEKFFDKEGFFFTLPSLYVNSPIDGFFAVMFLKND